MLPAAHDWFQTNTFSGSHWSIPDLLALKGNHTISVVLPALNEEATLGTIVRQIRRGLMEDAALVDELVVMDSGSTDQSVKVASEAGARVEHGESVLPHLGNIKGKGEVLWKSLAVTTGDIVVFADSDVTDFHTGLITGLLGPLLERPELQLIKAFYDRPYTQGETVLASGGGRVTELVARPLLNLYYPHLAGMIQPLAGEYAGRRELLESLPFSSGYGVEIGLVIDTYTHHGLSALAQVDLGQRSHGHQDVAGLARMSSIILQVVHERFHGGAVHDSLTQFARSAKGHFEPHTTHVPLTQRPALSSLALPRETPIQRASGRKRRRSQQAGPSNALPVG